MTRRARGLGAPSRIAVALLIAALAFAAAMMADGGYGDNPVFAQTTVDYDDDNDGLIDVRSLAQLNAIRHDLNGDGDVATGAPTTAYNAAFPSRDTSSGGRMGCPSGSCSGYELRAHLDFDTDGDGSTYTGTGASASSDSGDDYHNGGNGFEPIGSDSSRFTSTFKGNGYTIANLFIKRASTNDGGLFGSISGRVESVGLKNAFVHANQYVGSLVGRNRGTVAASWSDGAVRGTRYVGGLAGYTLNGTITASYSHASGHVSRSFGGAVLGGLTGRAHSSSGGTARVIASYSTGRLTAGTNPDVNQSVYGLTSILGSSTISHSYWDRTTSGIARGEGAGYATAALQAPTGYTGIYANWNVNLVGSADGDDPWHFGTSSEYPVLKFGGMSPRLQRGDYDSDDDGLIEITTLDQLNAVRHDLDGNGDPASGAGATAYDDAFLFRITAAGTRMGCPSGTCAGYELAADLDFDTDGDGATYTGTGASATGDTGDAYNNSGNGFEPIGVNTPATARFQTTFKGNGHTISNLFIKRTGTQDVGLFGVARGTARIESLGLKNAFVHGGQYTGALAGSNFGTIVACWSDGAVRGSRGVGGLVGYQLNASVVEQGLTIASYSHASATSEASGANAYVGGLIGAIRGNAGRTARIIASYSTGAVSATAAGNVGGFVTVSGGYQIVNSYWDSTTSGIADDSGTASPEGVNTSGLQSVLGYTGIYENWNVDVDGVAGNDDPWDFGLGGQYPALKYGGMDPAKQRAEFVDYDRDGDGLIEIANLAQLNVVRLDLNGDGTVAAGADTTAYDAAFPNRSAALEGNMGCWSGTCAGYELAADLDFDTDGDGSTYSGSGTSATGDTGDAYSSGNGFTPIGGDANPAARFAATFKGNGHVISNLFIKRATTDAVGLFGAVSSGGRVESLGVKDAYVYGQNYAGVIVGALYGPLTTSWASGEVLANAHGGGLAGLMPNNGSGAITASYSRANVARAGGTGSPMGGLVGEAGAASSISATYATGTVTTTGSFVGGIVGTVNATATVSTSYWDTATSSIADDVGDAAPEGVDTAGLQTPTGYTGIFENWNMNVDGEPGVDDPWDFGQAGAYPTLKFGGMDPADQRFGDYDLDGDGFIEIANLAQLDAVRHDLNGDGDVAAGAALTAYNAAFPDRITASATRMGCPTGSCTGYELIADLDFDTDGDGATYTGSGASATGDDGDAYYNSGSGWQPIGEDTSAATRFSATFKGNGYVISNLFIKRTITDVGLFGSIFATARVESVGVANAYVYGGARTGILAGVNRGTVAACWSGGAVRGTNDYVGGLVGYNFAGSGSPTEAGDIIASYSTASAHAEQASNYAHVGGLTGITHGDSSNIANVTASYSTGAVTAVTNQRISGLTYPHGTPSVVASYWDTTTSGIAAGGGGAGHDTAALQAPTGYTGIYANWNVNLDGAAGGDDPWDFGGAGAYPRLKYGGMDPLDQLFGDYDLDGDGLIEIRDLAQLDAVRHDLDGDGTPAAGAPTTAYDAAFSERITTPAALMGCPSGTCAGYELLADLDFDTDGDGATYTGTGADAASDSGDAYHNGGLGWEPIGNNSARFNTTFKGNGYLISNLFIKRATVSTVGLFGVINSAARVESLGVENAYVSAHNWVGALVGSNYGTVAASWSGGAVRGNFSVGGLVGTSFNFAPGDAGAIIACYSHASVHASSSSDPFAGGLAGAVRGLGGQSARIIASYSTGAVTAGGGSTIAGLTNTQGTASITDSYWDSTTSGIADDADTASPEGKPTADLQTVASYTGVYENWNVDVDGATGNDDPWHFGLNGEYPALKFGGMDTEKQRAGDYDRDGDGLIEISTLAQLDVIRHDLNGNGDATNAPYAAAFPDRNARPEGRMGCRGGSCSGYELVSDLDFDTDGDGSTYSGTGNAAVGDSNDAFYNGGAGWAPIGNDSLTIYRFHTTFKGNGHVIRNLFIKRPTTNDVGLFGALYATARVESVGVENAYVYANNYAGILLGTNRGTVATSWTSGAIRVASEYVGGLVGYNWAAAGAPQRPADVIACYSTASVHSNKTGGDAWAAGLVGRTAAPSGNTSDVIASYSTGAVTTGGATGRVSGLSNITSGYNIANSYWDSTTTGASGGGGSGQTTTALQTPTGYTGIFANWDVNVDGVTGSDDPWHFGFSSSYPTLKYGGMDPYTQHGGGDYDTDNDGLIEIWNLDRLNAVRWDLDGDAVQGETSAADWKRHVAAFPNAIASLGCPDTDADADSDPGPCEGYELAGDLDFNDANRDGAVDPVLAYPNWTPIGSPAAPFTSEFDGNNRKIANLKITAPGASASIGLFASSTGTVKRTGVSDAQISVTGGDSNTHIGALLGEQSGNALGNWSTGAITQTGGSGGDVGGLIGYSSAGRIGASWSGATVTTDAADARAGGLGGRIGGEALAAVYTTGAVSASGPNSYAGGVLGEMEPLTDGFTSAYVTGPVTKTGTCGGASPLYGLASGLAANAVAGLYWNTETTGYPTTRPGIQQRGYASSELQEPTAYATTIYATWDAEIDGDDSTIDDPWNFGDTTAYPKLQWEGMNAADQTIAPTTRPAATDPPCAW